MQLVWCNETGLIPASGSKLCRVKVQGSSNFRDLLGLPNGHKNRKDWLKVKLAVALRPRGLNPMLILSFSLLLADGSKKKAA